MSDIARISEIHQVLHEVQLNFSSPLHDVNHPLHRDTVRAYNRLQGELTRLQLRSNSPDLGLWERKHA